MGRPSKQLQEFMSKFKIDHDEIWEVRSGGAWAIKHSALERVAGEQSITFDIPQFAEKDGSNKIVAMLIVGHMGDKTEWSVGEASPSNNKNSYPYAMAEKRGKDRVILKLLNRPGDVYSEEEADDFKRQNPHVTRAKDIVPEVEYDEHGEPVDNIPLGDDGIERMPKAKSNPHFAELQAELYKVQTLEALEKWVGKNKNRVATLHTDYQEILRGLYAEHRDALRGAKEAAE
jgi:hypothetical protein